MKRRYSQVGQASGPSARTATVRYGVPGAVARPFKRVRVQGGQLVPYGRTSYIVPNALRQGPRNVKKGMDTPIAVSQVESDMANTNDVWPVNLLQAGTGSWNRIGRVVQMKSIRIKVRATCSWNLSPYMAGDPMTALAMNRLDARHLRMVVVYDKQPNGTLPQRSDIFQYKQQDGSETGDWNGFLAYDNMERFTILKDEMVTFDVPPIPYCQQLPIGVSGTGALETIQYQYPPINVERMMDVYLKLNLRTNYKAESAPATISDISTGALYVIFLCDPSQSGTPPIISANAVARLRYLDQ